MIVYGIGFLVFFFGLCIGSFMNVCIFRLPDPHRSIIHPRSMCPACNTPIPLYDNIPVLSYFLLKRKCRRCKASISFRYPLVELLAGLFALCAYFRFGISYAAIIYFSFIATLLVITFIDLDHQIIPDRITLPGIPAFFIASLFLPTIKLKDSLLGLLIGGGTLLLIGWAYQMITKKEGMGGGDIKLLAMIGVLLGWQGVLFTVFAASGIGTIAGILAMIQQRKDMKLAIPFGPFLSLGAILYVFFGSKILTRYLNVLR